MDVCKPVAVLSPCELLNVWLHRKLLRSNLVSYARWFFSMTCGVKADYKFKRLLSGGMNESIQRRRTQAV